MAQKRARSQHGDTSSESEDDSVGNAWGGYDGGSDDDGGCDDDGGSDDDCADIYMRPLESTKTTSAATDTTKHTRVGGMTSAQTDPCILLLRSVVDCVITVPH